jgi:hypothetical protein
MNTVAVVGLAVSLLTSDLSIVRLKVVYDTIRILFSERDQICRASERFKVQSGLVAGVFFAERVLNRSVIDNLQDRWMSSLVQSQDKVWWENWAKQGDVEASSAEQLRRLGNKWPIDLVEIGYVMSIGPLQITPRTAMRMCRRNEMKLDLCQGGIRAIVERLLSVKIAFEFGAAVIRSEWNAYHGRETMIHNIGLAATLYNMGEDYFAARYGTDSTFTNTFGRWIADRSSTLEAFLDCRT